MEVKVWDLFAFLGDSQVVWALLISDGPGPKTHCKETEQVTTRKPCLSREAMRITKDLNR